MMEKFHFRPFFYSKVQDSLNKITDINISVLLLKITTLLICDSSPFDDLRIQTGTPPISFFFFFKCFY